MWPIWLPKQISGVQPKACGRDADVSWALLPNPITRKEIDSCGVFVSDADAVLCVALRIVEATILLQTNKKVRVTIL